MNQKNLSPKMRAKYKIFNTMDAIFQSVDQPIKMTAASNVTASSLIVVSNRLPFMLVRCEETDELRRKASAGGLVTAVAPVVVQCGGLWVGWPGTELNPEDEIPEFDPKDDSPTSGLKTSQVYPVNLNQSAFELYYNGMCNGTFWPLFHSMPDRAVFDRSYWEAYQKVNDLFAEVTMQAVKKMLADNPDQVPLVWIHDYHLMMVANKIRTMADKMGISLKIGFFLHIPFPPWDMIRICPWAKTILQGLLGNDVIGFHTDDYCTNFIESCGRHLGCRINRKTYLVENGGRHCRVKALPIGIPYTRFEEMARTAPMTISSNSIKIILGVDRLDYTKGLPQRLRAFETFLEMYPEFKTKCVLMQIAVPSRVDVVEYQDLKEEMDKLVGQINGKFSTPTWSPIRYLYGTVTQKELSGYYRDSDVAFITPLRDGMNLVAKEFVACRVNSPGVLILSPFAGAGGFMHEALIVNPYEVRDVAKVLHRALSMEDSQRDGRMLLLRNREKKNDVNFWMIQFMKAMGNAVQEDGEDIMPTQMDPVCFEDFEQNLGKYIAQHKKITLLLDYDGTLAPIALNPSLAVIPQETKDVLERLSNNPDIFIAIISGRSVKDVKGMVGLEGITYAGNHGLEIIHPDGTRYAHPTPENERETMDALKLELEEVCKHGAWVEDKGALCTFHYREVPSEYQDGQIKGAKKLIKKAGFKIGNAHCALEVKSNVVWDKGYASIYILRTAFGVDWSERAKIIYVGDDNTDEDAIKTLKGIACTFRIVSNYLTETSADTRLPSTDSVLTMLKWVENHMNHRKVTITPPLLEQKLTKL